MTSAPLRWVPEPHAVEALLVQLGFRTDVVNYAARVSEQIARSGEAPRFLEFCASWPEMERSALGEYSAPWQALAVVAAFPAAIEKHRARGIPAEITRATLLDFQRRFDESYARHGKWEFRLLSWLRHHISGNLFEIGRLQYISGAFGYTFRVYRDLETNAVVPLALPGLNCTSDGWPSEEASAFVTSLEEREDGIFGHPTTSNGSIARVPIRLSPLSPLLLDADSNVLHIHIPWGEKLEREACIASLEAAKAFYEKYFPETPVLAFCTATWLLDPELGRILPAHSNIAAFGRLFHPLARRNATDNQLRERVFGGAEWAQCKAETSLQKAILNHHRNGGSFRSSAGFILAEEIETLRSTEPTSLKNGLEI